MWVCMCHVCTCALACVLQQHSDASLVYVWTVTMIHLAVPCMVTRVSSVAQFKSQAGSSKPRHLGRRPPWEMAGGTAARKTGGVSVPSSRPLPLNAVLRCFVCQWVLVDVHSFWARCHSDDHGHRRRVGGRLVVASRCCWEGGHCWTGDAAVCGQQDAAAASVVHGAFH
eukprot:scpid21395/ scgid1686/ 